MTPNPPPSAKQQLRRQIGEALSSISSSRSNSLSQAVCSRILQMPEWQSAQSILLFYPIFPELNVLPLWQVAHDEAKTTYLPRYNPNTREYVAAKAPPPNQADQLIPGAFKIPEPAPTAPTAAGNRLDFIVIPGVGFCPDGRRLGRGGGFYDRLLAQLKGFRCGVAYDEQIVQELPTEPHDIRCDCILTPSAQWRRPS
ncbi:MAG: 5-formyltetrahydrofolate cyclo-ligase [Limisphaerales bacterium]|jgi:5-formyltetrahydrofolate cyclo-ligase